MLYHNQVLDGTRSYNGYSAKSGDSSPVARAEKVTTEGKQGVDLGQLDGILEWLNAWNSRRTHERTLLLRQRDTCMWLPKTTAYKKWRDEKHGKRKGFEVLSISITKAVMFPAGAGKSVLAASVIEGLKDTLQDGEVLE
ncbi:hypothetical protein L210DRAFT_2036894 [Boletus edulis BED1]|uniref:Uncharacterized protein n=1 Tax=Boletus edulis BED1 TaxID=1328754 RepID=A0AAD4C9J5_BOLED|nr:hypothetical protein L210DRAFT_2036894 [Boletus edulis BED1]